MRALKKIVLAMMLVFSWSAVVYASDETNLNTEIAVQDQYNLQAENGQLSVVDNQNNTYTITLTSEKWSDNMQKVQFPVWSKINGQDDLKWYNADKVDDNTYSYTFKLSDHRGLGTYYIHAYSLDKNNKKTFLTSTEIDIKQPVAESIDVKKDVENAGKFKVVITGLSGEKSIKNVVVPIWSEKNGQDDLKWYTAQMDNDGNYYVDVDIKNHKYTMGTYDIHVYIDDVTGVRKFASKTTADITMTYADLSVTKNNDNMYTIVLDGLKSVDGLKGVKFPVWSKVNGQDDLKWYTAEKKEDGSWQCKVSLEAHKGLGTYNLHVYAVMPNGVNQYIGETTFEVAKPAVGKMTAEVLDKENGKFQIRLSGIENDELITKVQVPVWSDKKQSDIVWYTAEKQEDGTYLVESDISRHGNNCKVYSAHVYYRCEKLCM